MPFITSRIALSVDILGLGSCTDLIILGFRSLSKSFPGVYSMHIARYADGSVLSLFIERVVSVSTFQEKDLL